MCTRPLSIRLPPNPYERSQGIMSDKVIQVPCGHCPECLSKRQNDIAIRSYREALKFGSCFFVTLTYNPQNVPFAESLFEVNINTGEYCMSKSAHICSSPMLDKLRKDYATKVGLFVYEHDIATLEDTDFRVIYTPTLNYTDVRLTIKNFRVKYERSEGVKLPKFSYICVGEYGSKRSNRPHYHLLFFGLSFSQVKYFCDMWYYGFHLIEKVNFKNSDGSDGIAKVASYIGKYAAKGRFVPSTVLDHLTVPCKLASSRGLGLSDIKRLSDFVLCKDVFGDYDINNYCFSDSEKHDLFQRISDRLFYNFNGTRVSLPLFLRKKIFAYRSVDGVSCWSKIYYEVMDFARTQYQNKCDSEFRQFLSKQLDVPLSEAVNRFESIRSADLLSREKSEKERLAKFYSKSKF